VTANPFPNLHAGNHQITSDPDTSYNCFAWAAHYSDRWLDPLKPLGYWPSDIPARVTLNNFTAVYEAEGWTRCDTPHLETGYEKIAIYTDRRGLPQHAARQLENGKWTSKLGEAEDIEHDDLQVFDGSEYGQPARYMHRPRGGGVIETNGRTVT
jgi:hypothetical protein